MKWILGVIIGIVSLFILAVIALWLAGWRSDRGKFEVSVIIDRPAPVVFAALLDPEMTKKWVSGVIEIKQLTPELGQVGTKLLIIENIDGRKVEMEEEITYLDPPYVDQYTSRSLKEPKFMEWGEYRLEEKDGQTKFTMLSRIEYEGILINLLEPLITPSVRKKFAHDQQTLKHLLESH